VLILLGVQCLSFGGSARAEATAVRTGFRTEYAVPNGPRNLVAEAPGRIWFTAPAADGVGILTVTSPPAAPVVRYQVDFLGLALGSAPYDLVLDEEVIWFTLQGSGQIGRIDTATRAVELIPIPTANSRPTGIDVAPDGQIWFAEATGRLGRLDPITRRITEFAFSSDLPATPHVEQLRVLNDREIWFTLPDHDRVVRFNSVNRQFVSVPTRITIPGNPLPEGLTPTGLAIDEQGQPWIAASGSGLVGRYAPGTLGLWAWYATTGPNSGPSGITTFVANGAREVWFAEGQAGNAGRLQIMRGFALLRSEWAPLDGGQPAGITVDADRHIWVADAARNVIYEVTPPYFHHRLLTSVYGPNADLQSN
jgi:streptogramin lyase